jgi:hypothetical protein
MERKARSRVRLPGERLEDPVLPSQERSTQSHSDRQAEERPSSTYPPMSSKPPYIQGFQEYSGPSSATRSGWRDGVGAAGNLARWKRDDDLSREEMRRLDKTGKRANIYDVSVTPVCSLRSPSPRTMVRREHACLISGPFCLGWHEGKFRAGLWKEMVPLAVTDRKWVRLEASLSLPPTSWRS